MREVPAVITGPLDVRGQPEAAALREGSHNYPALGKNGEYRCKPPSPPPATASYAWGRSEHPL